MGKFGISLKVLAILTFVLAFFVSIEILMLVVAFCVVAEKDAWLIRQSLQALFLKLSVVIVTNILGWFFAAILWFAGSILRARDLSAIVGINSFLIGLVGIAFFVLTFIAVLNLINGKDAKVPLFSKLAGYAMGKVDSKKPEIQKEDFAKKNANVKEDMQNTQKSVKDVKSESNSEVANIPKSSLNWICECKKENMGNFCTACGNPKVN